MNSTRPDRSRPAERMAIIRMTPETLAALLQLPAGARVESIEPHATEADVLHLRVRGAGYEVRTGDLIPYAPHATARMLSDGENRWPVVSWNLPQAEPAGGETSAVHAVAAPAAPTLKPSEYFEGINVPRLQRALCHAGQWADESMESYAAPGVLADHVNRLTAAVTRRQPAPQRSGIENSVELAPVLGQVRFGDMGEPWDTRYPLGMLAEDVRRELAAFEALKAA